MEEKEFYHKLLKNEVQPILEKYAAKRELVDLAKQLGIDHRSRLTELKNGSRKLTFFWLNIFVKGGIVGVDNILKGRQLNELSEIELDTVLRLDPEKEELMLLYQAKRQGIDIKNMLKSIVKEQE
jgi:hypothetical protein